MEKNRTQMEEKKEKRSEFLTGLLLLYFVLCLAVTAFATETGKVTYGQISVIYLPMFFIFIYMLIKRYRDPEQNRSKAGTIVGILMCCFIIIVTLCYLISSIR